MSMRWPSPDRGGVAVTAAAAIRVAIIFLVDHQAHQRPTRTAPRKLRWHSCFDAHGDDLAAVAARDSCSMVGCTVGYVSQAPDHRVAYTTLALSAPPILTHYLAGQDGPIATLPDPSLPVLGHQA